ncbi:LA_2444/LA_4059 family outer membrane protein [Leptospira noguchii]|uniref:LA_2444/LA_4059 family outer membrane protein n=1 Tax=Leptospira noguchii TaxID=28182 RepID=UPI001FB77C02|nr:LA_2444/LA_4059 family outer membrane protein [Leptospira noguchii]UOG31791.1 LA_2444/LA_4059 family outer membrane protein [Leptospira noguchii]
MLKKVLRFSIWKKRFKIYIFLIFYIFFLNSVLSQTQEDKKSAFELLIKRQTYRWTPYDYTSYTERSILETTIKTDSIKQNQKVLIPLVFRYDQLEKKFRIEISAYEIELANPNTNVVQFGSLGFDARRQYFNPMLRSEAEFNYYKIINLLPNWDFFAGAGIRNINKYKYGYFLREGVYEEYFYTYGPQIIFRTDFRPIENLYFSLAADFFYTEGNRFYKQKTLTQDWMVVSFGNAGAKGIYRGYEIDFSISYRIFEKFKIYLGYNYIYSFFSYYGFQQTNLNFQTNSNDPFAKEQTPAITHPSRSGNHDILQGVYLGISVCF